MKNTENQDRYKKVFKSTRKLAEKISRWHYWFGHAKYTTEELWVRIWKFANTRRNSKDRCNRIPIGHALFAREKIKPLGFYTYFPSLSRLFLLASVYNIYLMFKRHREFFVLNTTPIRLIDSDSNNASTQIAKSCACALKFRCISPNLV